MHARFAPAPEAVTVTVPARLHLGFLDPAGRCQRRFGGIGLAITGFETRITIRRAGQTVIEGPEADRVGAHLATMRTLLGVADAHHVTIAAVVPAHAGLGSGTQIALAVATAVRRVHGRPLNIEGDAAALGRGNRSGVGIGLFHAGGLVVDGGRGPLTKVAPVVSRMPFPDEWRVLIVLDRARQGAHGPGEAAAFAALPPFPPERAADNCRLVLMQALPALAERDLAGFGAAISELQSRVGDYFAPIQAAGRFNSPRVARALETLAARGAVGMGQSSWGPTGFAFAADDLAADQMLQRRDADPRFQGLDICVCGGLNRGAQVSVYDAVASGQG